MIKILRKIATGNISFPTKEDEQGELKYRFPRLTKTIRKAARQAQKALEPKRTSLTDEEVKALFKSNFPK